MDHVHLTMEVALPSKYYFCILLFFTFCLAKFPWADSHCLEDQKTLLLEFRNEFTFDGVRSVVSVAWNRTDDCCIWPHVECNDEGNVIGLQLQDEVISGTFNGSSAVFRLRQLKKLNLANNDFRGSEIPSAIHNLKGLTHLNLSYSQFSGQVPLGLSSLRSLVSLDLSGLRIMIPNLKSVLLNLTRLRTLHLDSVNLSALGRDWIYIICSSLPNLQSLSLRKCGLSGPGHSSLVQLNSLSVLQLDYNYLRPNILDILANFSRLNTLTLRGCRLAGSFPDRIFQVPTLEHLDISDNLDLRGTVPEFPYGGSLRTIVLDSTSFSGVLPNSICNLKMLTKLDMRYCNFNGTIPCGPGNFQELTYLRLSYNSFSGPIPSFHLWKKLGYINLEANKMTGSLSSFDFEGNTNLYYLNLRINLLNGSIPQALFGVASLTDLYLSNNNFSGSISEFFTLDSYYNMSVIDLSRNKLEGPIPESFFRLKQLSRLYLSRNSFNGSVNFGQLPMGSLQDLDLSFNNLSIDANHVNSSMPVFSVLHSLVLSSCNLYSIPDLRNHSSLTHLILADNQITGEIPNWIWEIPFTLDLSSNFLVDMQKPYIVPDSLGRLDLHSNLLKGQLSSIFLKVPDLDFSYNFFESFNLDTLINSSSSSLYFSVSNNRIRGTIPTSLCNGTNLQLLDLSNNNLSGIIPSCIVKDLNNLVVLNLAQNNFNGNISNIFPADCILERIELQENNLGGKMPSSLAHCKSLQVMNVGGNHIEDTFPCMMPSSLRVLVLRSNKFHGEITCQKSNWSNIQIMDIASNNFSGYLHPMNFSIWRGMQQDNGAPHQDPNQLRGEISGVTVTLTFKSNVFNLTRILVRFTSIDFSNNNFQGEIPNAIGDLNLLYTLNLSHNALTGTIPESFDNLVELESLDLSMNQLTWEIPRGLVGLTFLSSLNLSYNKLTGPIPQGSQFNSFSASSFQGNKGLCGFPLSRRCSEANENGASEYEEQSYKEEVIEWEYVSAALGFVVGFGSIMWVLFGCAHIKPIFTEKAEQILEYIFFTQPNKRRRVKRK